MAPRMSERETAVLRDITNRLNSTSPERLPHITPSLASSLLSCASLLHTSGSNSGKAAAESESQLHKFKTRLSSLLQDRAPERRWSAVVLIKTAIEIGGWETLSTCSPWVMNLRGILSKSDPPATKKLVLITLTRIFLLTREYPTLLREITTPALPEFITRCLHLLGSKSPSVQRKLTDTILSVFAELIPRHPATFRPYVNKIREAAWAVIAGDSSREDKAQSGTPNSFPFPRICRTLAQRVISILAFCTPKEASGEWESGLIATIETAHRTADQLFRAVIEEWESTAGYISTKSSGDIQDFNDEVQSSGTDTLGLPDWRGITGGTERMITLLGLLGQYMVTSTPEGHPITLRLGPVLDLLNRIFAITVPGSKSAPEMGLRLNQQVDKHERQALWASLPSIHVAALELVSALVNRSGPTSSPVSQSLLEEVLWVFQAEHSDPRVRMACYDVSAQIIDLVGPGIERRVLSSMTGMFRDMCADLVMPETKPSPAQTNGKDSKQSQQMGNADALLNPSRKSIQASIPKARYGGLFAAASNLLRVSLTKLTSNQMPRSTRALLDRTAVLSRDENALVASVLNTQSTGASVIPILARNHSGDATTDGILRPRMPTIPAGHKDRASGDSAESQEAGSLYSDKEEDEEDLSGDEPMQEADSQQLLDVAQQELLRPESAEPLATTVVSTYPPSPKRKVSTRSTTQALRDISPPSPKRQRIAEVGATEAVATSAAVEMAEVDESTAVGPKADRNTNPLVTVEGGKLPGGREDTRAQLESDDSDDDFEIPALEMGVDSDDE
jgi:pre-rRNA-processing protein RIX1